MYKTMEQIHKEYDGQWVFMINCDKDEYGTSVAGGEVVVHDKSRKAVGREMAEYDSVKGLTLIAYAGKVPEGVLLVL